MVDLSKARAGDTVKFRCGGTAVIEAIKYRKDRAAEYQIVLEGYDVSACYPVDGIMSVFEEKHPLDITEVIPAPVAFDWSTAKAGMAFTEDGVIAIFVGKNPFTGVALFTEKGMNGARCGYGLDALTRAPEHDVEVG